MAIDVGARGAKGVRPTMNITPLVDVVLVLLIIFMVVTPLLYKQLWVHAPKPDPAAAPVADAEPPVHLSLDSAGAMTLNGDPIERGALGDKLRRVFAARGDRTMFLSAADGCPYGVAVDALDLARGAGAVSIAIVTELSPR